MDLWGDITKAAVGAVVGTLLGFGLKTVTDRIAARKAAGVRRRAHGPFFVLHDQPVHMVYGLSERGLQIWQIRDGNILWAQKQQLTKDPSPLPVILLVANKGEPALSLSIEMDGCAARFCREPELSHAHGLEYIAYEYSPQQKDRTAKIRVRFTSMSGEEDLHVYETVHGRRVLRRIDPP